MHPSTIDLYIFRYQLQGNNPFWPFSFLWHTAHQVSWSCHLWLSLVFVPPPPLLLLLCFIFWWFRLQALGNAIPHCALWCQHASCLSRELWSLSCHRQQRIVILEVACVCLTEARVSWSSSSTPLALVCKGTMTDGDPSSRRVKPPLHSPLHTFPFLFMRAKTNKRGVQRW